MGNQFSQLSLADRFWQKVEKSDGCWTWRGALQTNGYGKIYVCRKPGTTTKTTISMPAHRASWVIHFGDIPTGMSVLHRCDNPLCVRPDHLFLGDHTDNMRDCAAKGRNCTIGPSNQTHCRNGHEYTSENTIRRDGWRRCRTCYEAAKNRKLAALRNITALNRLRRSNAS